MADWLNVGVGESVLPGDVVNLDFVNAENRTKIVLGPGLQQLTDSVVVTKPGVLRSRDPAVLWIDSHQKRVGYVSLSYSIHNIKSWHVMSHHIT